MKILINVLCISLLTACAATPVSQPPVLVPPTKTVSIPSELLVKCKVLSDLTAATYTEGDVVDFTIKSVIAQSEVCRAKDSILVDTVRSAFNIPLVSTPSK
jgi:hypothetical protein